MKETKAGRDGGVDFGRVFRVGHSALWHFSRDQNEMCSELGEECSRLRKADRNTSSRSTSSLACCVAAAVYGVDLCGQNKWSKNKC